MRSLLVLLLMIGCTPEAEEVDIVNCHILKADSHLSLAKQGYEYLPQADFSQEPGTTCRVYIGEKTVKVTCLSDHIIVKSAKPKIDALCTKDSKVFFWYEQEMDHDGGLLKNK